MAFDSVLGYYRSLMTLPRPHGNLKAEIDDAVRKNARKEVGILFSGGLDSSVIAAIASRYSKITCYTAGLDGSQDLIAAEKVAGEMGWPLEVKLISDPEVPSMAKKVERIIHDNSRMRVGVGIPIYACCSAAREHRLLSGSGAEELFAGYAKFRKFYGDWPALRRELRAGLWSLGWKDLYRDISIAKHFGKELRAPLLEPEVMATAMAIHPKNKLGKEQNKLILRKIAKELGLPAFAYDRPKKAAQYGSGIDRILRRCNVEIGMAT